MRYLVAACACLAAASACNPSLVTKDHPLYKYVGHDYYLGRPLSGPQFRHPNLFGAHPVLKAGTRVTVTQLEHAAPYYRIYFTAPGGCEKGCMAHWRFGSDADFETLFRRVFVKEDPLAGIPEKAKEKILDHQVWGRMPFTWVLLALGEPNYIVPDTEPGRTRWIYERRNCDVQKRLLAQPELALIFEKGLLVDFEELDANAWYVVAGEPISAMQGLCRGAEYGPGTQVLQSDRDDFPLREVTPGEANRDPEERTQLADVLIDPNAYGTPKPVELPDPSILEGIEFALPPDEEEPPSDEGPETPEAPSGSEHAAPEETPTPTE